MSARRSYGNRQGIREEPAPEKPVSIENQAFV